MQTTTYNAAAERGRLLPTQIIVYAVLVVLTIFGLWPALSGVWRRVFPARPNSAATSRPTVVMSGTLASEVTKEGDHLKQSFAFAVNARTYNLYDVLPVDMADLEKSDVSRNRAGLVQSGNEALPSLAGIYKRGRVATSDWPKKGSAAIELTPTMATDPENPAKPWRVVLLFATSNEATALVRQAVADGRNIDETIVLGHDAQAIPAVPVDRVDVEGTETYYCVCPAQATLAIAGVRLMQKSEPTSTPELETHNRWQVAHDNFLSKARQRASAAITPEEKQQVQTEIADWKQQNPEPPRPASASNAQTGGG